MWSAIPGSLGIDEAGTHGRLKARFTDLIEPKTKEHGGRIVKLMGDGILAEFSSAIDAVKWAVELQTNMAEINARESQEQRIEYRVGVNLGDVIVGGDDIFGDGVNVAARLQEIAEPGGICVSEKIHMEVAGKTGVEFTDGGAQAMKNIEQPIQVWRWSSMTGEREDTSAGEQDRTLSLPDKPSIAVLPLDSMSSDPEHEYLADGMTEDIITLLARIPSFFVIARNSTFSYKGSRPDIRQVGRDLGVRYVVEGSLRQIGSRLRVTVQLIEAESGNHIWAERFDRKADDLFDVQDEITVAIVTRLEPELTRVAFDLARRPTARRHGCLGLLSTSQQYSGNQGLACRHIRRVGRVVPQSHRAGPEFRARPRHAFPAVGDRPHAWPRE
ncbi:MAG: adenylate/guanylate cyclase domain-containing protein [Alphaproteobacteria bacterium]